MSFVSDFEPRQGSPGDANHMASMPMARVKSIQRRFIYQVFASAVGLRPISLQAAFEKGGPQMRIIGFPDFSSFIKVGWRTRRRRCWRSGRRWHCRTR